MECLVSGKEPPSAEGTISLARLRQGALIGVGCTIILMGLLLAPLPGPGGLPVALVGGAILLRNSPAARRLFIRTKRRYPRMLAPVEKVRLYLRRRRQR